jgi:hypothetical protein
MVDFSFVRRAAWAALVLLMPVCAQAADDFEADLLRKFQKQNQNATRDVKSVVEKNVAQALALGSSEPEKAYLLLQETRFLLDAADRLPRPEREALERKLAEGFRDAKARLESKKELARSTTPTEEVLAGPVQLRPNIVPISSQLSGTVTPIVSPDRRWVRISLSGSFFFRSR